MRAQERVAAGVGQSVGGGARALRRLTRASLGHSIRPIRKACMFEHIPSRSLSRSLRQTQQHCAKAAYIQGRASMAARGESTFQRHFTPVCWSRRWYYPRMRYTAKPDCVRARSASKTENSDDEQQATDQVASQRSEWSEVRSSKRPAKRLCIRIFGPGLAAT